MNGTETARVSTLKGFSVDTDDILNRFTYHPPKMGQGNIYEGIREAALGFADYINEVAPDSREKSLAITALEETVFWANAAVARHG